MGRNCCITIERQYGSGGREVARILSERLGIPCYGRELLAVTAADNGISIEELKMLDEKRTGSLLHDLVLYAFRFQNYNKMQEPFDINKEVSDTIRRLARKGPCIFIGRCADFALDGECDVLKLFIYASSMEKRKRRICEVDDIAFEKAEEEIQKRDSQRSDYYHYFTGKNWGDMENYDACLNTSVLGYEGCADLIMKMME